MNSEMPESALSRLNIVEHDVDTFRDKVAYLEQRVEANSASVNEARLALLKQGNDIPLIIQRIDLLVQQRDKNNSYVEASLDKLLHKVDLLEVSFNNFLLNNAITGVKMKIIWALIVFVSTAAGGLITHVLQNKLP